MSNQCAECGLAADRTLLCDACRVEYDAIEASRIGIDAAIIAEVVDAYIGAALHQNEA